MTIFEQGLYTEIIKIIIYSQNRAC